MNKTERQWNERQRLDRIARSDQVFYDMIGELRTNHREFAGSNYDVDYDKTLDWVEFVDRMDKMYIRRVSRARNPEYKRTKNYRRWETLMNMFRNVVKKGSNQNYKYTVAVMNNLY